MGRRSSLPDMLAYFYTRTTPAVLESASRSRKLAKTHTVLITPPNHQLEARSPGTLGKKS